MKKIITALLAASLLLCTLVLAVSCKDGGDGESFDYTVTVTDGGGVAVKGIIIKLYDDTGTQVGANVTDAGGKAVFKNILAGEYTAKIANSTTKYNFLNTDYELVATKDGSVISFIETLGEDTMEIYGAVADDTQAHLITPGYYSADIAAGETVYFVLNVAEEGTYRVDYTSKSDAYIGYYGIPMFVQAAHCLDSEGEYDGQGFNVEVSDINTPHVIGITAESDATVVLNVKRTGELPNRPEYMDWVEIPARAELSKYTLPTGATLGEFDITDPELEIVLEKNGKYYTKDGNLIVLRICTAPESPYLAYTEFASLKELAGLLKDENGNSTGTMGMNIGGYIYDSEGNFVTKETYNSMIATYIEYCDETAGVYPLTDELINMIKVHGNSSGWWRNGTVNYLFNTNVINEEYAWLFICSYVIEAE
ncbi:MAG: hypothetical protein IJW03_01620 [Clostridia bacterium]|nr:hypothetical protein [Clostridia bacterium]